MSLVDLVSDLQPDVEQDGLSLEVVKGERRLHINRDLQLEFSNDTVQVSYDLDDQTQVDSKPAGQPEHASLNQCQLIAANRCSGHPQLVVEIRFLCNVIDTRALIGTCSHVTSC